MLLNNFIALADVKIEISNIKGKQYKAKFKTQLEADAWIADNIANDSWGKKERWEKYTDQTNCLEIVDVMLGDVVEYQNCKLPVEWTIEISDITAEVEAEKAKKEADDARIDEIKVKDKNNIHSIKWLPSQLSMI